MSKSKSNKAKKRRRADDIPSGSVDSASDTLENQAAALRIIEAHLRCEKHNHYCFVQNNGDHGEVDVQGRTYWAGAYVSFFYFLVIKY